MHPYGLCVHTSGRGIVTRAKKKGVLPVDLALKWYRRKGSVHFLIDYDGTVYQMLDANRQGAHVGISKKERNAYLNGAWANEVPTNALLLWLQKWPKKKSPQHLYPSKSPNQCYVGVELLPMQGSRGGMWFTDEQCTAVKELYNQLAAMYGWPLNPRKLPNTRLLGHEDIDAFGRWQKSGGWDPGALRKFPRFSWDRIGNY